MKIVCVIPHSHTYFWTQTCVSALERNLPRAGGAEVEIVVVDNSHLWSPAIRGITETRLGEGVTVFNNPKSNQFHASALDAVVDRFDFDYLMALETDVLALRPDWLEWFLDQMEPDVFAVGHWHHEMFVNPSCTLYRGDVLREMNGWCKTNPEPGILRWGANFATATPMDEHVALALAGNVVTEEIAKKVDWLCGPFAEKRGWPEGTVLPEAPSGQMKGPGWYEPGQALHHWALAAGYRYVVCPTNTFHRVAGLPAQTLYGSTEQAQHEYTAEQLFNSGAYTAHLWGGTRALDILKHPVTCEFVKSNMPFWMQREARFWQEIVPGDVQAETIRLIHQYGFHYKGQGTAEVTDRDRAAAELVLENYRAAGVPL